MYQLHGVRFPMPEQPPGPHDTWYKLGCSFLIMGALAGAWYLDLGQSIDAYHAKRERLGREEIQRERERVLNREREIAQEQKAFISFVDQNNDGYLAPQEITSGLRKCGYSMSAESGMVRMELDVNPKLRQVVRIQHDGCDTMTDNTIYRIPTSFIEECMRRGEYQ